MKNKIKVGDIVKFRVNTLYYESKVFKMSNYGRFVFVDYFEGPKVEHRRSKKIPIDEAILISKCSNPVFSIKEIKALLHQKHY